MTASITVQGRIAEPEPRFTSQGKAVLELRICATRRTNHKQDGEWSDDGAPLWLSATFWEAEAERLAEALSKGDNVTVQGDLVMEEYQKRDGGQGSKLVIRFPRFLGVVPRATQNGAQSPAGQPNSPTGGYSGTPAANGPQNGTQDVFGNTGGGFDDNPPF